MVEIKDYYDLLGIGPDASPEEVRRAYRDRAQDAMWDRPHFAVLAEAFDTLKDPPKRAAYDLKWHAARGSQPGGAAATAPPRGATASAAAADAGSSATIAMNQTSGRTQAMPGTSSSSGGAGTARGGEATMQIAPCPICSTAAPPDEGFCAECGFLLTSTPGPEAAQRPLPFLVDAFGKKFTLRAGDNIVGREGADVTLPDRTVSRRHARIAVQGDGDVWMEDLGSTNGTQRAGHPLPPGQRAALGDGTQLQFGAIKLTISVPDAPLALPLPQQNGEPKAEPVAALEAPPGNTEPVAKLTGTSGQVYALTETTTTFGRRSTNHYVLSGDPYVSGAHAQIVFTDSKFHVLDLGSTNGTTLNGRRLGAHALIPLADGDKVVMGRTPLVFATQLSGHGTTHEETRT